jgi:hypothetical protein
MLSVDLIGWERGSPEPLMGCGKPKEERLWSAALPAMRHDQEITAEEVSSRA